MKNNPILMTLSDKGFIEGTKTILGRLLAYYICTDPNQSLCFRRDLRSLPNTYYLHINAPEQMAGAVAIDIETILDKYYDDYEVETDVRYDKSKSKADIALYASVVDGSGERVGLGKVVSIDESGLGNVVDVNNFGEAVYRIRNM